MKKDSSKSGCGLIGVATRTVSVAMILAVGLLLRLHGVAQIHPGEILSTEARLASGAAIIAEHFPITHIGSYPLPLVYYYPVPFVLLLGRSIFSFKLSVIVFSVAAILFVYLAGKELFSHRTGLVAAAVMASLKYNIVYASVLFEHSFMPFYVAITVYLLARLQRTGNRNLVFAMGVACGLGISTYIIFIYFMIVAFVAGMLTGIGGMRQWGWGGWLRFIGGAALGLAPVFVTIFLSRNQHVSVADAGHIREMFEPGVIWASLIERIHMMATWFSVVPVAAGLMWGAVFVVRKRTNAPVLFLVFTLVLFLPLSVFTPTGMDIYHLLVISPLAALLMGSVMFLLEDMGKNRPFLVPLCLVLCAAVISYGAYVTLSARGRPFQRPGISREQIADAEIYLSRIDADKTLFFDVDVEYSQQISRYILRGDIPPPGDEIVSWKCNRFRTCGPGPVPEPLLDVFIAFYLRDSGSIHGTGEQAISQWTRRNTVRFKHDLLNRLHSVSHVILYDKSDFSDGEIAKKIYFELMEELIRDKTIKANRKILILGTRTFVSYELIEDRQ